MAITALPTPPSRNDPTNFSARGDAFLGALPAFATEANALAVDVNADAVAAAAAEVAATAAASAATAAANVTKWVSGTTYAEGVVVWSPITYLSYRRKTAGAGTTDPSADSTNWAQAAGTGNQEQLVSGTNIKTINGSSVLGSGDLVLGGDYVLISTVTASASSTADFVFPSGYASFQVVASNVVCSNSNSEMQARFSVNGGSTFDDTGYMWQRSNLDSTLTDNLQGSTNATEMRLMSAGSSVANTGGANFIANINNPINASFTSILLNGSSITTGANNPRLFSALGYRVVTTGAVNAVRFFPGSGTMTGQFKLYGRK